MTTYTCKRHWNGMMILIKFAATIFSKVWWMKQYCWHWYFALIAFIKHSSSLEVVSEDCIHDDFAKSWTSLFCSSSVNCPLSCSASLLFWFDFWRFKCSFWALWRHKIQENFPSIMFRVIKLPYFWNMQLFIYTVDTI